VQELAKKLTWMMVTQTYVDCRAEISESS